MKTAIILTVLLRTILFCFIIGDVYGQDDEPLALARETDGALDTEDKTVLSAVHDLHDFTANTQELSDDGQNGGHSGRRRHNGVRGPQQDCNNGDIAVCVKLLEVLTNKDLGFAATIDELNRMCPVLLEGLQCIDRYTRRCLTQKHREYFNKLYAGTIRVIKDLCNTRAQYQQEYVRHAPCMRQVNPKYNACSVTYHAKTAGLNHINEADVHLTDSEKNTNVIILCCSFQEYLQCSERVVYETCGNETALFTKQFLDRMAGPIVQFKCSQYAPGSQVCEGAALSSAVYTSPSVTIFSFTFILIILALQQCLSTSLCVSNIRL